MFGDRIMLSGFFSYEMLSIDKLVIGNIKVIYYENTKERNLLQDPRPLLTSESNQYFVGQIILFLYVGWYLKEFFSISCRKTEQTAFQHFIDSSE